MPAVNLPLIRGWVVVIVASTLATFLLDAVGLPSPVLFGTLLGGIAYALTMATPLAIPARAFNVGQALVGVTIGAMVNLPALDRLGTEWPSVLAVTLGTVAISVLAGRMLAFRRDVTATTGAFALIAGGASGITALARELGADEQVVTIVQYLRVLLVLLAMPLVTTVVFHPPTGRGVVEAGDPTWLPADVLYTVAAVVLGLVAARYARIPAGSLLGPLLVAVGLSVSGVLGTVTVPSLLANAGYALIGVQVGLRFTRASLRSVVRLLPWAVVLILVVIAACAAMGVFLSSVTGIDGLSAYLATTPGGVYAVLAMAADSGADVTYVLAVQVIRVFVMLLAAPLLARLLRPRSDGAPAG
ncbi:MAG TPA: AbrB family transcriptional regulator [Nocardioidaceae bacterium]|nr:AbrB family transcriptional regulator [Nocardioidaceae bacterium]